MRVGGLLLVTLLWGFTSCGLETVATLPFPDVDYNSIYSTPNSLSMVHKASRYQDTDFDGYEIYYRIYPVSSKGIFSNLIADRDALSTSPTVSRLTTNLGYSRFTVSASSTSPGSDRVELLGTPSDGEKMELDFQNFLSTPASNTEQPQLLYNGIRAKVGFLYRSMDFNESSSLFHTLRTVGSKASDMAAYSESLGNRYEIDIYIAAYGFTPTLETVYSKPVPWGVIYTVKQ